MQEAFVAGLSGLPYRGSSRRHLLLGGSVHHTSSAFASKEDAQAWLDQAIKANREAGRKIGTAEVSNILVGDHVKLI